MKYEVIWCWNENYEYGDFYGGWHNLTDVFGPDGIVEAESSEEAAKVVFENPEFVSPGDYDKVRIRLIPIVDTTAKDYQYRPPTNNWEVVEVPTTESE